MARNKFRRKLAAGEVLFREGDAGVEAYVIESGALEIFREQDSVRTVVARLGVDEVVGEMALAGGQMRTAGAIATQATTLMVISQEYLAERLTQADPMLRHLLRVTLSRFRDSLQPVGAPSAAVDTELSGDRKLALDRLRIEQDLEHALEHDEFELHYQPILRLDSGRVAGFEALIRWTRPGVGRVPPDQFIGVAEESGLIVRMGHWIMQRACTDLRAFDDAVPLPAGETPRFMAINLSVRQFGDPVLLSTLSAAMTTAQIAPRRIKLEITESLLMNNINVMLKLLAQSSALGVQLAIDDFGTGYSSLSYLHRLKAGTLKLDRSFVREMQADADCAKVVRAIAWLAAELGMDTVCEGIETEEQAAACHAIGITYAQGFLYTPALPLPQAIEYLRNNQRGA